MIRDAGQPNGLTQLINRILGDGTTLQVIHKPRLMRIQFARCLVLDVPWVI